MTEEMLAQLAEAVAGTAMPVGEWRFAAGLLDAARADLDDGTWLTVPIGHKWDSADGRVWLRARVALPAQLAGWPVDGMPVVLRLSVRDGARLYVNGEHRQTFRGPVGRAVLSMNARPGQVFTVAVCAWADESSAGQLVSAEVRLGVPAHSEALVTDLQDAPALIQTAQALMEAPGASELYSLPIDAIALALEQHFRDATEESQSRLLDAIATLAAAVKFDRVHVIPNSHIDTAWRWRWDETVQVVRDTWATMLKHIDEYSDYRFTGSAAQHYAWMEERHPDLFARIRECVRANRWELAGGWWVEADSNIPGGESLCRQGLYGQRYYLSRFGRISTVAFSPDTFGHCWTLPQILKLSRMSAFIFGRPSLSSHGGLKERELPSETFLWEGPDGTRILAMRRYYWEHSWQYAVRVKDPYLRDTACFFGAGDHGGGPNRPEIERYISATSASTAPNVFLSTLEDAFAGISPYASWLPIVRDELQHHARGCYTSHSGIKRAQRKLEHLLLNAEKACSWAAVMARHPYPADKLQRAWQLVLFNQFHDIMGGCSIKEVYDDAAAMNEEALGLASQALNEALRAAAGAWAVDLPAIVLFNPCAWPRRQLVEVTIPWDGDADSIAVWDGDGSRVCSQESKTGKPQPGHVTLAFEATLPPLGWHVYRHTPIERRSRGRRTVARGLVLENRYLRVELHPETGQISRILDKKNGVSCLAEGGTNLLVLRDYYDTWGHEIRRFGEVIGRFGDAKISVLEAGPVRGVIRVESRYGLSTATQDVILGANARHVEVRARIDWQEQYQAVKLSVPTAVESPTAAYEIPYGVIERPANGEEEPGQQWIDVSGLAPTEAGDVEYGVGVSNDGKYGFDILDGELRVTLLRSPGWSDHDLNFDNAPKPPMDDWVGREVHEVTYGIHPHAGDWRAGRLARAAEELNSPILSAPASTGRAELRPMGAFAEVSARNVVITAVKMAEDGGALIVRAVECHGRPARNASVRLPLLRKEWRGRMRPWEIKTLRFPLSAGEVEEVDILEFPLGSPPPGADA